MEINDAELNARLFKAFTLGKHIALEAFNVEATAAEDSTFDMVTEVAEGKRTMRPNIEVMLRFVPHDKKQQWRKRLEKNQPERDAAEREIAKGVVNGMNGFFST